MRERIRAPEVLVGKDTSFPILSERLLTIPGGDVRGW